jgi:hypothetical protein
MGKLAPLAVLLLAACVGHGGGGIRPLRPLEIATAPYEPVATTALAGSLMYEGGCLLFRDEQTGAILMPVWPEGSTFNGTAVMFHEPGKTDQRVMVAEEFLMSGQPLQWATLNAVRYQPLQHQCGAYLPFFAAKVRPAN